MAINTDLLPLKFILITTLLSWYSCDSPETPVIEQYFDTGTQDTWHDIAYDAQGNIIAIGGYVWLRGLQLTADNNLSHIKVDTISFKGLFDLELLTNGDFLTVGTDGFLFQKTSSDAGWVFHRLANWDILQRVYQGKESIFAFGGKSNERGYIYKINNRFEVDTAMYFPFEISDAIITDHRIIAFGWGNMITSDTAGLTWKLLANEGDFYASGIMLNEHEGLIIGYNGDILRTEDGGVSWKKYHPDIEHSGYNAFRIIKKLDNGSLLICGNEGKFWHSIDDGKSWTYYRLQKKVDLYGCLSTGKNSFILCGEKGTLVKIEIAS